MGTAIGLTIAPRDYTQVLAGITTQAKRRKAAEAAEAAKQRKSDLAKLEDRMFKLYEDSGDYTVNPLIRREVQRMEKTLSDGVASGITDPTAYFNAFRDAYQNVIYYKNIGKQNAAVREAGDNVVNLFPELVKNTANNPEDLMLSPTPGTERIYADIAGQYIDERTGIFRGTPNTKRKTISTALNEIKATDDEVIAATADEDISKRKINTIAGHYSIGKVQYTPGIDLAISKLEQTMSNEGGILNATQDLIEYYGGRENFEKAFLQKEIDMTEQVEEGGLAISQRPSILPRDIIKGMRIDMANNTGELSNWISANVKSENSSPIRTTGSGGTPKPLSNVSAEGSYFTPSQVQALLNSGKFNGMSNQQLLSLYNNDPGKKSEIESIAGAPGKFLTLATGATPSEPINFSVKGKASQAYSVESLYYNPTTKKYVAVATQSLNIANTPYGTPAGIVGAETFNLSKEDAASYYSQFTKTGEGKKRMASFEEEAKKRGYTTLSSYAGITGANQGGTGTQSVTPDDEFEEYFED